MKTLRSLGSALVIFCAITAQAQPRQNNDFGSKFFDDLQVLFGRLQQSELDQAFQQAKPVHCSDLVGEKGEWKEVAFLNDDRSLGNWHRTSIDEVKKDLAAFVFSGSCGTENDPVAVATSYPIKETVDEFREGKIPFTQIVIRSNPPVGVTFDQSTSAYTFRLPYLYVRSQSAAATLYTLIPPQTTSKQEKTVSEEFRCKALSDSELTYRFLLCRTRLADSDRRNARQPLGNAAYYILSDGKEASATVKLMFGPGADANVVTEKTWTLTALPAHLLDVENDEFRLRFNPQLWNGRIDKPQLLAGRALWDFLPDSPPSRSQYYCVWRPNASIQAGLLLEKNATESLLYSLTFAHESETATSAVFGITNNAGVPVATLQCYFPQSATAEDVRVYRWIRIVGPYIGLEVKR